jgi:hypothetical protein
MNSENLNDNGSPVKRKGRPNRPKEVIEREKKERKAKEFRAK